MCMIDGDSGTARRLHARRPKARKEHKCGECRRTIAVGETYLVERLIFDGSLATEKCCSHCEIVRAWLIAECGGFIYECVAEDIYEHAAENAYGAEVKLLSIGIGRKWTRKDGKLWRIPKLPPTTPPAYLRMKTEGY